MLEYDSIMVVFDQKNNPDDKGNQPKWNQNRRQHPQPGPVNYSAKFKRDEYDCQHTGEPNAARSCFCVTHLFICYFFVSCLIRRLAVAAHCRRVFALAPVNRTIPLARCALISDSLDASAICWRNPCGLYTKSKRSSASSRRFARLARCVLKLYPAVFNGRGLLLCFIVFLTQRVV